MHYSQVTHLLASAAQGALSCFPVQVPVPRAKNMRKEERWNRHIQKSLGENTPFFVELLFLTLKDRNI